MQPTPSPRTRTSLLVLLAGLGLPMLLLAGCRGGGSDVTRIPAAQAIELHSDSLMAIPGVAGVYEGRSRDETVIRVMLAVDSDEARRRIPRELEGYRVEVEVTGPIEPMRKP